jgi:hypothetical protein
MGVSATWLGLDKGDLAWIRTGPDVGLQPLHRKPELYRAAPCATLPATGFSILPAQA